MGFPDAERYLWFSAYTQKTIERCRRVTDPVDCMGGGALTVYVPGGDNKYPSFWVRDAIMQCRSSLVPREHMLGMLDTICAFQNGCNRRELANGLCVNPWAVPDHINLPGLGHNASGAVFYPGSYSTGNDQGTGRYGVRPPDDDISELVDLVRECLVGLSVVEQRQFLEQERHSIRLIDRLDNGMRAIPTDEETGLVWNKPDDWAASNFHDALQSKGAIAGVSCVRFRAARQMAAFFKVVGNEAGVSMYTEMAARLAESIPRTLQRSDGWLMIASKVDRQPDLWYTSLAVYENILVGESRRAACEALSKACADGDTLTVCGYMRHLPTWGDAVPGKIVYEHQQAMPEIARGAVGHYQYGGYWPQAMGWVVAAIHEVDAEQAGQLACAFIDHTREHEADGSPFEWINPTINAMDGKWYGPSAALPFEAFRRLAAATAS